MDDPYPPAHDSYGGEPSQSAAQPPHRGGYDYASAPDEHDRAKLDSAHASHAPSGHARDESLENDTQKTLEDLLALWAPLPVGGGHSLMKS